MGLRSEGSQLTRPHAFKWGLLYTSVRGSPASVTIEAFSVRVLTNYRKLKTSNCLSAHPAVHGGDGLEFFDFRSETDASISRRLAAATHIPRSDAPFLD